MNTSKIYYIKMLKLGYRMQFYQQMLKWGKPNLLTEIYPCLLPSYAVNIGNFFVFIFAGCFLQDGVTSRYDHTKYQNAYKI